nr:hypothetical protein [Hyphomonas sp. CY54-11-8]
MKGENLVDRGRVSLVAGDAVEGFGDNHIELTVRGASYQFLYAGARNHRAARDRAV